MEKWRREAGRPICACGCGKQVKAHGSKYYHGHAGRGRPIEDRFWAKVEKTDGCWLWIAAIFRESGYGQFCIGNKKRRANRVAWELTHGASIPSGMVVRHTCDNPRCVRPDHLLLGTQADNSRDMIERGRTVAKLTPNDAKVIRLRYAQGSETYQSLAQQYGVSSSAIGKVIRGQSHRLIYCDDGLVSD